MLENTPEEMQHSSDYYLLGRGSKTKKFLGIARL